MQSTSAAHDLLIHNRSASASASVAVYALIWTMQGLELSEQLLSVLESSHQRAHSVLLPGPGL